MYVSLDHEQAIVLRDLVTETLKQTRIESARTDSHDYREMLYRRERVLEQILDQLTVQPGLGIS